MTGTVELNANPRNLFLGISLVILCCAASIGLGMNATRLTLVLAGAGFSWLYSFLTFCDPYTHCDFIQNGNAAVAFIAVYSLGASGGFGAYTIWAVSCAALIASELLNTFITGSKKWEFPVMGLLLTVMAAASAAMIYLSFDGGPLIGCASALTGWATRESGFFCPAVLLAVLCAVGTLVYLSRDTLLLYSHGKAYFRRPPLEQAKTKAGLILGKAVALSISFSLIGVFGGVAYYLMTVARSRYSRAESMTITVLFALVLSSASSYAGETAAIAGSVLASQALFQHHKKISRGLR